MVACCRTVLYPSGKSTQWDLSWEVQLMKRSVLAISVVVALLLAGCGGTGQPSVTKNSVKTAAITRFVSLGGAGEDMACVDVEALPDLVEAGALPETLPVVVDHYPTEQTGPTYDVTDQLIAQNTQQAQRFLTLLYGDSQDYEVKPPEVAPGDLRAEYVSYDAADFTLNAFPDALTILTGQFDVAAAAKAGRLLDNTLVKAAIAYLNLQNPQTTEMVSYMSDGSPHETRYTITDAASDAKQSLLNSSFHSIELIVAPDDGQILMTVVQCDSTDTVGEAAVVDYDDAVAYAAQQSGVDEQAICAEVVYRDDVEPGYWIPCYKFYAVEETVAGNVDLCEVVYVPMLTVN